MVRGETQKIDDVAWLVRIFNLKRSVGQGEVCVCGGAGQGAATRNSPLFARRCNAAMRRHKRAIHPVT
jgi:hypothetical protein